MQTGSIEYVSYVKARAFAQSFKFKNQKEWFAFAKTPSKPKDIPAGVANVYKDSGWKGWKDFLGNG